MFQQQQQFLYGEVFPPQPLVFQIPGEVGREQMCITQEALTNLSHARQHVPRLSCERDERHCFSGKTRHCRTVLSVVRYSRGWRVFRRFFDEWTGGIPYDLCHVLSDHAILLPTSDSAIDAAEVFSFGQHWDVVPLVWLNDQGQSQYGEPRLLLSPDFSYKKPAKHARKNRGRKGTGKGPALR